MMKNCPLCHTEMPERYNYCYQCGEYIGHTSAPAPPVDPEHEQQYHHQERIIHYGCLTLIVVWTVFGLWFCVNMNR
jgi:predicted nucleic acid-binding Zn ribbon protein